MECKITLAGLQFFLPVRVSSSTRKKHPRNKKNRDTLVDRKKISERRMAHFSSRELIMKEAGTVFLRRSFRSEICEINPNEKLHISPEKQRILGCSH